MKRRNDGCSEGHINKTTDGGRTGGSKDRQG